MTDLRTKPPRMTNAVYKALLDVQKGIIPAVAARDHGIHPGAVYLAIKRHNLRDIMPYTLRDKCIALRRQDLNQAEIAAKLGKTPSEISRALKDRRVRKG